MSSVSPLLSAFVRLEKPPNDDAGVFDVARMCLPWPSILPLCEALHGFFSLSLHPCPLGSTAAIHHPFYTMCLDASSLSPRLIEIFEFEITRDTLGLRSRYTRQGRVYMVNYRVELGMIG